MRDVAAFLSKVSFDAYSEHATESDRYVTTP
jgi:hypothetical protein